MSDVFNASIQCKTNRNAPVEELQKLKQIYQDLTTDFQKQQKLS